MPNEHVKIGTPEGDLARWFGDEPRLGVQRAVAELRADRPVRVTDQGQSLVVTAAEMMDSTQIAAWHAATGGAVGLILPAPRLRHLGVLANTASHVSLDGISPAALNDLLFAVSLPAPAILNRPADAIEIAALELVKRAYLLPAAVVLPLTDESSALVAAQRMAIENFHESSARHLSIAARTRVPLADSADAEFVVFRGGDGLRDQVAVVVGKPDPHKPVLTRLHSACLTGDLFASLKCDCGDQLRLAVTEIAREGGGVLLYLDQEGRGIGLLNKMRAYGLQQQGHDTLDADAVLGYGPDERRYEVASAMLALLGFRRIVLMTNNPTKIAALESFGVQIVGHQRLITHVNPHNHDYLTTKARRAGHMLGEI